MRGWHDVLPQEVLLFVFHLASANRLLDESIRETFHLVKRKRAACPCAVKRTRHSLRATMMRTHTFRLRSLLIEKTYDSIGLFPSATSMSTLLFDFAPPVHNPSYFFLLLYHLADTLEQSIYPRRQPLRATRTDLSDLLNEYDNADLEKQRCLRLFEYLNVEIFDYDRIALVRDPVDGEQHAMPCSVKAEEFYKRWYTRFGAHRDDIKFSALYGYSNELTEHDVSASWFV